MKRMFTIQLIAVHKEQRKNISTRHGDSHCNPGIQEAEAGGSKVRSQAGLDSSILLQNKTRMGEDKRKYFLKI
jgi:hypothetical protein